MSANDELPRGLTLSTPSQVDVITSVTFPATVGIAWVLTDVAATATSLPTAGAFGATINASPTPNPLGTVYAVGADYSQGLMSWSGQMAGAVGDALTVTITNQQSQVALQLIASAYPI